jgi:Flp pilus assembly pilin Flp
VPLATWVPAAIVVLTSQALGGSTIAPYRRAYPFQERLEFGEEEPVAQRLKQLWNDERGQDIAEYAVMLAVILVIVVGTIRLIGSNANNVFSQVGSAIQ